MAAQRARSQRYTRNVLRARVRAECARFVSQRPSLSQHFHCANRIPTSRLIEDAESTRQRCTSAKTTASTLPTNGDTERQQLTHKDSTKAAQVDDELAGTQTPSVLTALARTYKWPLLVSVLYKLVFDVIQVTAVALSVPQRKNRCHTLQFAFPALLAALLQFVERNDERVWLGVTIAIGMFFVAVVQSMVRALRCAAAAVTPR